MDFSYHFPVVKGLQANREYYIAMVPLRMIPRLFPADDEYVPPEYRAQRKLNIARIPVISKYIIENRESYVFSALAASIDGEFAFIPSKDNEDIGILDVSMDAKLLINDGQHRKAAILEAINEDSSLLDETISVVFYSDLDLARSQQMFTDLNKHAVKTSNSIAELYDSRDSLAVATRNVITKINFLNKFTDKEIDNLGKYSSNLFTLSTFYKANSRIIKKASDDDEKFLYNYWNAVVENIVPWQDLKKHEISKIDLRENYVVTMAVIIQALGRLGKFFYNESTDCLKKLEQLQKVDWHRNSHIWKSRIINEHGRIVNNETAIILACNAIKKQLGIKLDSSELVKEKTIK